MAKRAEEEGLKFMSEAVEKGPMGGVVWFRPWAMLRGRLSRTVRPAAVETEKQVTPPMAPPFRTHTVVGKFLICWKEDGSNERRRGRQTYQWRVEKSRLATWEIGLVCLLGSQRERGAMDLRD